MGSAALAHVGARGRSVLGIEQFARGHALGASSGRSRIIRKAYFEDPAYVPLLRRAYELWFELERRTGLKLIDQLGLLLIGSGNSALLAGTRLSAERYDVTIENLSKVEVERRYPTLRLRPGESGVFEAGAGMVFPEAAIEAHLTVARDAGADMRFETRALRFSSVVDGVRVDLHDGSHVVCDRLIVCAGPWLATLCAEAGFPVRVQRNVQLWFAPTTHDYDAVGFPAFLIDRPDFPAYLYGFPDHGYGVKAALHAYGEDTTPNCLDREIHPLDIERVAGHLEALMPGATGHFKDGKACMYALTPDEHFIISHHADDPNIVFAGGFSGHGFKFCPVIGEICADLALAGKTTHPIGFLHADRFLPGTTPGAFRS